MPESSRCPPSFPAMAPVVPSLEDSGVQLGAVDDLRLKVEQGMAGRVRLAEADSLKLEIHLLKKTLSPAVKIWTDLGPEYPGGIFHWYTAKSDDQQTFYFEILANRCGSYHFAIQYSWDGLQWYWLRGTPWHVQVYPKQLQALRLFTLIPNISGPSHDWPIIFKEAKELGFTLIHLLPLTQQGRSQSPYAAKDLFQVEHDFLLQNASPSGHIELEQMVSAACQLGMGLCFDLVLNHVAVDSHIVRKNPHWIIADCHESDGMKRAGFSTAEGFHKWQDLVLINYHHPDLVTRTAIWNYMKSYAFFWCTYASATRGMIRLDNLHSTPQDFASNLTTEIRQRFPTLGILAELFGSHEMTEHMLIHYEIDLLLATSWEHHFSNELRHYLEYLHDTHPRLPWFTPVNSHDSGVPADEFADVQSTQPRYVLSALLGTGGTGMTQGVERGILQKINFIGRQPQIKYAAGANFRSLIQQTNMLLANHAAFQEQGNLQFIDQNHVAIIAGLRRSRDPHAAIGLVIANLDIHESHRLAIDFQTLGLLNYVLRDAFTGHPLELPSPCLNFELAPCGYQVVLATPEPGVKG